MHRPQSTRQLLNPSRIAKLGEIMENGSPVVVIELLVMPSSMSSRSIQARQNQTTNHQNSKQRDTSQLMCQNRHSIQLKSVRHKSFGKFEPRPKMLNKFGSESINYTLRSGL